MPNRVASCGCGAFSIALTGEPVRVNLCNCIDCQRRTGSVFGVGAYFNRPDVGQISGKSTQFDRSAESGNTLSFRFCPTCGTTLHWENNARPGVIDVAVGAFADPEFPSPGLIVWTDRKHSWVTMPGGVPAYPKRAVAGGSRGQRGERAPGFPANSNPQGWRGSMRAPADCSLASASSLRQCR